jgi:predicted Zn-dependent protease
MGDLAGALAEIEQAIAAWPDNPDWVVFKGVLERALGQDQAAEATFAAARALFSSESAFLLSRARNWMALNSHEAALADAQAAVALEPDSALGNLILGQAYEQSGKDREAIDAYQLASDLADVRKQPQIAVMARMLLGMLMQKPLFPTSQP